MNKIKFLTLLLAFSGTVNASCNKYACEGVSNVVFSSVVATTDEVKIKFHEGTDATLSCSLDNDNAALLNSQSANYRNMQSMLLTAIAANLPIALKFDNTSPICEVESIEVKVVE
ncbi:hypothetical protein LCGC14_2452860 [marine sediment metagenome]|uniref:Fimbrial protein n=2 Tax=root TaxID=1 RepID=A0A7V1CY84_9GAMM|nr:hypothetical protein [Pseudoalteromonas prydzensis]HEA16518.1 hypothetical protein [Pseudoalteromonas prydzensis]